MTIVKTQKLDLNRISVIRIVDLIEFYKSEMGVKAIYFNDPIDGITHYDTFVYYDDDTFKGSWYFIQSTTLLKVIKSLKNKDFYVKYKTKEGNYIKARPKK